jgi:quinohemoprotein ethanol dehydrogenase
LTFALGANARLPADLPLPQFAQPIDAPEIAIDPEKARPGGVLFARTCVTCHGSGAVASGYGPDLRASAIPLSAETFERIVRGGALLERDMAVSQQ